MAIQSKAHDFTVPDGFTSPTVLPTTEAQHQGWQQANRTWWENHPMRYDFQTELAIAPGTAAYYREIDRRFFADAWTYMPWRTRPFERLMPFGQLPAMDVLEIGVGMGSHAQLLAASARSFRGIDLTQAAVDATRERFRLAGLDPASIEQMDAEHLEYPDASFDFVWSWGVVHHSANTQQILAEIRRVLRPGGRAVTMVYHRNAWNWYIIGGFFHGVLRGAWLKHRSLLAIVQEASDGGIARYYTAREWRAMTDQLFADTETRVFGSKAEMLPLPGGRVKSMVMAAIPDAFVRFFANWLRMGRFLVAEMRC